MVLFFLFHLDSFSNDIYEFKDSFQEQRFFSLIDEIRCPKCTSGSLASSDAPVSKDLKDRIYFMILDEKSDQEIKDFVIQRYGKQSDYNPSFSENLFLWLMPLIFFISIIIFFGLKKRI
ncbi:MAG: cytochrome c-type biogenesis protein CcmH [SAR86 cluster bacterium]|uniref:Cytochrome c-type biogenesis protein n=1 Tax=SAR86 cluster bacterium TaxID=2030880 RepID=A0A368BUY2_9GAMM|nr:MAG: cytochrome c-type biogenesis protein CcmH [SAR86 cluster bacterium]